MPSTITTIDADYFHPQIASIHMLSNNGHAAFIDTGTHYSMANVEKAMQNHDIPADSVDWVILTHIHLDHAGGAGSMMQLFPNAKLVVHPFGSRHMADPSKLIAGTQAVYGKDQTKRIYGDILPIDATRIIETYDGMTLDFQGEELLFLDTPGHAKHHHCIYHHASRSCFTGDTLGLAYPHFTNTTTGKACLLPTTTPVQFSPQDLHNSIDKVMALQPNTLYLTHYGPIQIDSNLIARLHEHIEAYVLLAEQSLQQDFTDQQEQYAWLNQQINGYMVRQVMDNQPSIEQAEVEKLLSMDAGLNAQGLIVWLQKKHS